MDDMAVRGYAVVHRVRARSEPRVDTLTFKRVLVYDTETLITQDQEFLFGSAGIWVNGRLEHFYLIYSEALSNREIEVIRAVGRKCGYKVIPRQRFIEEVYFPEVYEIGTLCVCFNTPFDTSRFGVDFTYSKRKKYKGGFSIKLSWDKRWPAVLIKNIDSKRSFVEFATPSSTKKSEKKRPHNRGNFLDLKTAVFVLTNESHTLESALKVFGCELEKQNTVEYGSVTRPAVEDNINHTMATHELYEKVMERYEEFNLDKPLNRIYSPAGIVKGYLSKMGLKSLLENAPDFPPEILGYVISAYYGGRSEVRIRKMPVKVTLLDATSMYTTVYVLQEMDSLLKAQSIRCIENTQEVQELINNITLEDLRKPATWKKLHSICLIKPDNDVLPYRSRYAEKDIHLRGVPQARTIGINYVTSVDRSTWWWTVQDALACKLLAGKAPTIERAITFEPVGVQEGLEEIKIINGITVKPDENMFKKVIEERIRTKKRMGKIETSNPEYKKNQEWITSNSTQNDLKTIANSGTYGIYQQLNPEPTDAIVDVYGLTHIMSQVDKLEVPGPMFNPIVGIFQTAGARLMLAAVEALLDQHGGYYAGCDTDSMFVSPQHAQMIQDFFQPLNPYDVDVSMFKIETDETKEKKPLVDVWYYGISAKRYVLYDLDPSTGRIKIRKYSSHGLGQLNLDEEEWWTDILTVHYHPDRMEDVLDKYRFRVAAHQMTITKYDLWRHFDKINEGKPVSEMIKPFNFITVGAWRQRHPKTGEPIIPTTPYVKPDSKKFELLPYESFIDKRTGDVYTNPPPRGGLETQYYWNDMAGVFERYINHPEYKSEGDIGLLEKRHMYPGKDSTHYIGKESDDLEETIMEGDDTDECLEYVELPTMKVKTLTTDEKAAHKSGIPRSTYYYAKKKIREGQSYTPQKHNRKKFKAL